MHKKSDTMVKEKRKILDSIKITQIKHTLALGLQYKGRFIQHRIAYGNSAVAKNAHLYARNMHF